MHTKNKNVRLIDSNISIFIATECKEKPEKPRFLRGGGSNYP